MVSSALHNVIEDGLSPTADELVIIFSFIFNISVQYLGEDLFLMLQSIVVSSVNSIIVFFCYLSQTGMSSSLSKLCSVVEMVIQNINEMILKGEHFGQTCTSLFNFLSLFRWPVSLQTFPRFEFYRQSYGPCYLPNRIIYYFLSFRNFHTPQGREFEYI